MRLQHCATSLNIKLRAMRTTVLPARRVDAFSDESKKGVAEIAMSTYAYSRPCMRPRCWGILKQAVMHAPKDKEPRCDTTGVGGTVCPTK
jgi:hypothetical protein